MKPIEFKEQNLIFAENQKEYLPLPAHKTEDGEVISCWRLTFIERVKVLIFGNVWMRVLTFNDPLQPQTPSIDKPFEKQPQEK
jgi:hypothetical protein